MGQYEHQVSELHSLASRLNCLADELSGLKGQLRGYEAVIGHPEVNRALRDFADNWDDKRKGLLDSLEQLSGYVKVAADTYAGVSTDLTELYTVRPAPPAPGRAG